MGDPGTVGGAPDAMERAAAAFRAATETLSGCRPTAVRWQHRMSGDRLGDARTTEVFSICCGHWDRALAELTAAVRTLGEEVDGVGRSLREAGS